MTQSVRGLADDVVREFDRPDGHQLTSSDQTQENSDDEEFEEASWDGETFDADTDWTAVDKLAGNNRDSYPAAESVTNGAQRGACRLKSFSDYHRGAAVHSGIHATADYPYDRRVHFAQEATRRSSNYRRL